MELTRTLEHFKIKKPRKDEAKIILRERLSDTLGRTKKSVFFSTIIWTEDMLRDALNMCQHYTTIQTRNWHFNQYIAQTKNPN